MANVEMAMQRLRLFLASPRSKWVYAKIFTPRQLRGKCPVVLTTKCQISADIMLFIVLGRLPVEPIRMQPSAVAAGISATLIEPRVGEAVLSYYSTATLRGVPRFGDHVLLAVTVGRTVHILDSYYKQRTFTYRQIDSRTWANAIVILAKGQGQVWDERYAWAFQIFGHVEPGKMSELTTISRSSRLLGSRITAACSWRLPLSDVIRKISSFSNQHA
jgi:hypothetical protein